MQNLGKKVLDRVDMVSYTLNILKNLPYYAFLKPDIIAWVINDLYHRYTLVDSKYQREFYFLMKQVFCNLDIYDLNFKFLTSQYAYPEFILIKNKAYDEFNRILFLRYKNAKQEIKELKHDRNLVYQRMYDELEQQKNHYEELLNGDKIACNILKKMKLSLKRCLK